MPEIVGSVVWWFEVEQTDLFENDCRLAAVREALGASPDGGKAHWPFEDAAAEGVARTLYIGRYGADAWAQEMRLAAQAKGVLGTDELHLLAPGRGSNPRHSVALGRGDRRRKSQERSSRD